VFAPAPLLRGGLMLAPFQKRGVRFLGALDEVIRSPHKEIFDYNKMFVIFVINLKPNGRICKSTQIRLRRLFRVGSGRPVTVA
jgi:hypothetical protein